MNHYQFYGIELSKKYLLEEGYYSMYRQEDYLISNKIVAILDVSSFDVPLGKSALIHAEHGTIFDERTTKQLINSFYEINVVGFALVKALSDLFGITHYRPFVHGYLAYMPVAGASRNNTDWVALFLIKDFKQADGVVHLKTTQGHEFEIDFPKGNFDERAHNVALISKGMFLFFKAFLRVGFAELQPPSEMGILARYEDCQCPKHIELLRNLQDLDFMILRIKKFMLVNLGIDAIGRDDTIKYYSQNLARLKKNY